VGGLDPPHMFLGGPVGPKKFMGAPLGRGFGAAPLKRNFWKNFVVKYCNFVVNLNRSSLGWRFESRSYVMVFSPRRQPSIMYEGISLHLCMRVNILF
jgi:hypothetical protein